MRNDTVFRFKGIVWKGDSEPVSLSPNLKYCQSSRTIFYTKSSANWSHADALIDRSPCLFGLRCVISTSDSLLLKTGTNYPSRMADTLTILCLTAGQSIQTPLASQFLFYDALSSIYHQQFYRIQRTLLTAFHPACNITNRGFWPARLEKAKLTCKVILHNSACQERMKHSGGYHWFL